MKRRDFAKLSVGTLIAISGCVDTLRTPIRRLNGVKSIEFEQLSPTKYNAKPPIPDLPDPPNIVYEPESLRVRAVGRIAAGDACHVLRIEESSYDSETLFIRIGDRRSLGTLGGGGCPGGFPATAYRITVLFSESLPKQTTIVENGNLSVEGTVANPQ